MARLEITVSNQKTGQVTAHEVFDLDDQLARLLLDRLEQMAIGLDKPVQLVKTISPGGAITLDLQTDGPSRPPVEISQPTFEERFRRPALPPPREEL